MMTMFELLEAKKESILAKLKDAGTPAKARFVLEDTMDSLLYQYISECQDDHLKEEAAYMVKTFRTGLPLIETNGETKIWERRSGKLVPAKKAPKIFFSLFLLAGLGCVITAAVLIYLAYKTQLDWKVLLNPLLFLAGGIVCLFLAGLFQGLKRPGAEGKEQQVEVLIDAEMTYRCLSAVILQIDKNLAAVSEEDEKKAAAADSQPLTPEELDMYAGMLQALAAEDGVMALEQLENAKHHLHTLNIDLLDYDPAREAWFEFLPGTGKAKTMRPAMAYKGTLLKKGLATGGQD